MKLQFSNEYLSKLFEHNREGKLTHEDIAILIRISSAIDKENTAKFGMLELANFVNVSVEALQESLDRLQELEYVGTMKTPFCIYVIINPKLLDNWEDVPPSTLYYFDASVRESCRSDDW